MLRMVWLLSLIVLAGGCASTQKAVHAPPESHAGPMQIVPLKFAAAPELARELDEALGGNRPGSVKVVVDARTNSLVLMAEDEEGLAKALELVARLDVEVAKAR